jgi:hypothetical protein
MDGIGAQGMALPDHHQAFTTMSTTDRVAALWAIYDALDALITPDEIETYPCLEHLGDLIEDLQLEADQ